MAPHPVHAQTLTFSKLDKEEIKHPSHDGVGEVRPIAGPKIEKVNVLSVHKSLSTVPTTPSKVAKGLTDKRAVKKTQNSVQSGRDYSKEEVQDLIIKYSQEYGINPEVPLCIAKYESSYNYSSKNRSSSASGVFQYLQRTWKGTDEGKAGLNVFDADANVRAAVKYMASRKSTSPWEVKNKCPKLIK